MDSHNNTNTTLAKVNRPVTDRIYLRNRLFECLDLSRQRRVVFVSGPGGSGKTTLISSYIDNRKIPYLWYQMDPGDDDPATFFYYFSIAVDQVVKNKSKQLPLFTPEYQQGIETFTLRYFEALYERMAVPHVIVFDNYQEIPEESGIHLLVRRALSIVPAGITVVLLSRKAPPKEFTGLRANRQMETLGWNDLRLSTEETGGIIELQTGKDESDETVHRLHEVIDGWAAGLILILSYVKTENISLDSAGERTCDDIFHYFTSELFDKTDPETREMLLKTSLFPRMTVEMAEALTGLKNSGDILSRLYENQFFTDKRVLNKTFYQYHPLFQEFLLERSKTYFSTETYYELKKKAALLLEENGEREAAVCLLQEIEDWDTIFIVIMTHAPILMEQGRLQVIESWTQSIPDDFAEQQPWINFWKGACIIPTRPRDARQLFQQAYQKFKEQNDAMGSYIAWSGLVEAVYYGQEHISKMGMLIDEFDTLQNKMSIPDIPEVRVRLSYAMFVALVTGRPQDKNIQWWLDVLLGFDDDSLVAKSYKEQTMFTISMIESFCGNFDRALQFIEKLRFFLNANTISPMGTILMWVSETIYCQITGDTAGCEKMAKQGQEVADKTGIHFSDHWFIGHPAQSALNVGDLDRAAILLQQMEPLIADMGPSACGFYYYLKAREALIKGCPQEALPYLELKWIEVEKIGLLYNRAYGHQFQAHVLHALGQIAEAETHVLKGLELAIILDSQMYRFNCMMLQALFALDRGEETLCLSTLTKALSMGKNQCFLNNQVDNPATTARLCIKALEADIETEYVQTIIRKRRLVPEQPPIHLETWPWPVKIYTLGDFRILLNDNPIRFKGKSQEKPLAMLKILLAKGGQSVKWEQIADEIWPDADGDKAYKAFATTLHRLRKILDNPELIVTEAGSVSLDPRHCWTDIWAFDYLLNQLDAFLFSEKKSKRTGSAKKLLDNLFDLYRGPFLNDEGTASWAITARESFRRRLLTAVEQLGRFFKDNDNNEQALNCLQKGIEVEPSAEECYYQLIKLYRSMGRVSDVISIYNQCKTILFEVYGIKPSRKLEEIYQSALN